MSIVDIGYIVTYIISLLARLEQLLKGKWR